MSDPAKKRLAVIGGLLNKAQPPAKKVLAAYDSELVHEKNVVNMKKFKAEEIEACAVQLGFNVKCPQGVKLYKNQAVLTDRIILRIVSLFEAKCSDCDTTYQNTLEDSPPFSCALCTQGSHNCDTIKLKFEEIGATRPLGLVWLCSGCLVKNDLSLLPPPKPAKSKKKLKGKGTDDQNSAKVEAESSKPSTLSPVEEKGENTEKESGSGDEEEESEESPRRDRRLNPTAPKKPAPIKPDPSDICPLYKKRACPHGRSGTKDINGKKCDKSHPRRCFNYTRFGSKDKNGCNKGTDCDFWHPRLCPQNLKNQKCSKADCTFFHMQRMKTRQPAEGKKPTQAPAVAATRPVLPRFSIGSDAGTPYPPTVDMKRNYGKMDKRANQTDSSESILLQKMENMKQGFEDQLSDFIKKDMPAMLKDLIRVELQSHLTGQSQLHVPQPQLLQTQATTHPLLAHPWYNPSFPRSYL